MAHLATREVEGKIDLTPALQHCVTRARRYQRIATIMKGIVAVAGVFILVLLRIWEPLAGPSTRNTVVDGPASGEVEYRGEDESEEEFETRLQEAIDDHINRHNFAHEFFL